MCGHPAEVSVAFHSGACAISIEHLQAPGEGTRVNSPSSRVSQEHGGAPRVWGISHPSPQVQRRLQHEAQWNSALLPAK